MNFEEYLFGTAKTTGGKSISIENEVALEPAGEENQSSKKQKAVWEDEDDQLVVDLNKSNRTKKLKTNPSKNVVTGSEYDDLLRQRFQNKSHFAWADVDNTKTDKDLDVLFQSNSLLAKNDDSRWQRMLNKGKIDINRLADANITERSDEPISVVKFDKTRNLLLVGSRDRHIRLFNVDGDKNEKVFGVKFEDLRVSKADFLGLNGQEASEIVVCGRKPFFYTYDIVSGSINRIPGLIGKRITSFDKMQVSPMGSTIAFGGKGGYVHFVSAAQKAWMFDIKMNTPMQSMTYLNDNTIVTSTVDAEVYLWDLRYSGKCINKFRHEDGTASKSLATYSLSNDDFKLAVGADSGVVATFDCSMESEVGFKHEMSKSIMNLITPVTTLKYHPSGDILAIASDDKKDELRLVNTQTGTCFSNWPSNNTPLHYVTDVDFSSQGAYMAVGNKRGNVLLYRLMQFSNI